MSTISVDSTTKPVTTSFGTTDQFLFDDGVLDISSGLPAYYGTSVTDWYYDGKAVHLDGRGGEVGVIALTDESPAGTGSHLQLASLGSDLYLTEGGQGQPAGATVIKADSVTDPVGQSPTTQPQPPDDVTRLGHATIYDTTTQAYIGDHYSYPYQGPVAGLQYDCEPITPDSLNITARADSMFIKTNSGNDAIALQGGTNVVDAGGGSNFITGASGFDTFYLDARNIPAASSAAGPVPGAIWDTIENFGTGDAATLWSIGRAATLSWQKDGGAVGHTGITLHANKSNGTEASLTFAGIDSKADLSLNYGSVGGVDYLYVKAA